MQDDEALLDDPAGCEEAPLEKAVSYAGGNAGYVYG